MINSRTVKELDNISKTIETIKLTFDQAMRYRAADDIAMNWALDSISLHSQLVYNGMEKVIASELAEKGKVSAGPYSHQDLLNDALEQNIIVEQCFNTLNALRVVRHQVRHAYTHSISPEQIRPEMEQRYKTVIEAWEDFKILPQIEATLESLPPVFELKTQQSRNDFSPPL